MDVLEIGYVRKQLLQILDGNKKGKESGKLRYLKAVVAGYFIFRASAFRYNGGIRSATE